MNDIWKTISGIQDTSDLRVRNKNSPRYATPLPNRQVSREDYTDHLSLVKKGLNFLEPGYQFDVVPLIRKIKDANSDVSQAFKDVIQLANTGHELKFDPGVSPESQKLMREEIDNAAKNWVEGSSGIHGIVNKMFAQLLVGGAIANEWVPNFSLTSIEKIKFLYPERIRWARVKGSNKYVPYQKINNNINGIRGTGNLVDGQYVKLNPTTFRYYSLLGDAELPYGIPPYLPSLAGVSTQGRMLDNIDKIVSIMGILGWAEALMDKPDQRDGEGDKQYADRLNSILTELKGRVQEQLRDGVSVGFKDDHEFDFKQTVKSAEGVDSLWATNEQQIASGLDFDPAFMGRSYNTSETMITILFTKMIAQLTNIQNTVEHNLTYGLDLFLKLRGFKFKYIKVEFHKSTITDDLKYQQAMEIKGRVAIQNYLMGTINEHMYAREMGYDSPVQETPRVPPEVLAGKAKSDEKIDSKRKEKDKSERSSKEKRKEGPVRKTKPVTSN